MNHNSTRLHGGRLSPDRQTGRREATGTRSTDLLPYLPEPRSHSHLIPCTRWPRHGATIREELELSRSSAYSYTDELVNAGLLVEVADSQAATRYMAIEWTVTIEIDDELLTVRPLAALVVANETEYPSIGRVVEGHGLETLQR